MTDLKLNWDNDLMEADFGLLDFDLETEEGMSTAIIISLFTDARAKKDDAVLDSGLLSGEINKRGWWADGLGDDTSPTDSVGSRLWLLERATTIPNTENMAKNYIKEALQWMVDDGICQKIDIITEKILIEGSAYRLNFNVKIYRTLGGTYDFQVKWDGIWSAQFATGASGSSSDIDEGYWQLVEPIIDFEVPIYVNGILAGQDGWTTTAPVNKPVVASSHPYSGTQSFKTNPVYALTDGMRPFTFASASKIIWMLEVYVEPFSAPPARFSLVDNSGSYKGSFFDLKKSGAVYYFDWGGGQTTNISVSQYYTIKVAQEYDSATGIVTWQVWLDGVSVATGLSEAGCAIPYQFRFYYAASSACAIDIDDIEVWEWIST